MGVKTLVEEVEADVKDIRATAFSYAPTPLVPSAEDPGLTFERNVAKKGMEIESCVLFADIRDSVTLTEKHQHITMGRIYTAFTKAVGTISGSV
jgi:adenylate cyclase